jgi:hypothetical protein
MTGRIQSKTLTGSQHRAAITRATSTVTITFIMEIELSFLVYWRGRARVFPWFLENRLMQVPGLRLWAVGLSRRSIVLRCQSNLTFTMFRSTVPQAGYLTSSSSGSNRLCWAPLRWTGLATMLLT